MEIQGTYNFNRKDNLKQLEHSQPQLQTVEIVAMETDASNIPLPTNEDLSPTEQDLLDEYERLAENMKTVCFPSYFFPSPPFLSTSIYSFPPSLPPSKHFKDLN